MRWHNERIAVSSCPRGKCVNEPGAEAVRQGAWLWAPPCGQSRYAIRLQGRSTLAGNGEHKHPNRGVQGPRRAHLAMYAAVSPLCTIAESAESGSLLRIAHSSRGTAAAPCVLWIGSAIRWRARVAEPDKGGGAVCSCTTMSECCSACVASFTSASMRCFCVRSSCSIRRSASCTWSATLAMSGVGEAGREGGHGTSRDQS